MTLCAEAFDVQLHFRSLIQTPLAGSFAWEFLHFTAFLGGEIPSDFAPYGTRVT